MARNFDGRLARHTETPLFELWRSRYADTQCVGNAAWELLLDAVKPWFAGSSVAALRPDPAPIESALMEFLAVLRPLRNRRRPRRLYVAYRQADIVDAKRLGHLGNAQGVASWLDAHDELRFQPGMEGNPLQEVLSIAAIEMGLLNASHLVVVHAPQPEGSTGYLLGRAREHAALSGATALWSDEPMDWSRRGSLVPLLQSERMLARWLEGLPLQPSARNGERSDARLLRPGIARPAADESRRPLRALGS